MDLLKFPENSLDVLAQFMIGLTIIQEWDIDDGYELVAHLALQSTSIRRLHRGTGSLEKKGEYGLIGKIIDSKAWLCSDDILH